MPAAAVIPAPIAYTKVVAVKKLVVGFLLRREGRGVACHLGKRSFLLREILAVGLLTASFTVKKSKRSKQALCNECLSME